MHNCICNKYQLIECKYFGRIMTFDVGTPLNSNK